MPQRGMWLLNSNFTAPRGNVGRFFASGNGVVVTIGAAVFGILSPGLFIVGYIIRVSARWKTFLGVVALYHQQRRKP